MIVVSSEHSSENASGLYEAARVKIAARRGSGVRDPSIGIAWYEGTAPCTSLPLSMEESLVVVRLIDMVWIDSVVLLRKGLRISHETEDAERSSMAGRHTSSNAGPELDGSSR